MSRTQKRTANRDLKQEVDDDAMANRYCLSIARLPAHLYTVKEKYLKRFRRLVRYLTDANVDHEAVFEGLINVGDAGDEIWVERGLSEPEKRFVIIHELVHARRQQAGEEFEDYRREEPVVELEAIARTPKKLLRQMPNALALLMLRDFLTDRGQLNPNTFEGLIAIHRRICHLLGVDSTLACGMPPEAHRPPSKRRKGE